MYRYGKKSRSELDTCDPDIIRLFEKVAEVQNTQIVYGHRGEEIQNKLVANGASEAPYPKSDHNKYPSLAVDAIPYPKGWQCSIAEFVRFRELVYSIAGELGIKLKPMVILSNGTGDYAHFALAKRQ